MADERSSAGIITVVVAVITVAGGIAVALINNSAHKHPSRQGSTFPPGRRRGRLAAGLWAARYSSLPMAAQRKVLWWYQR